MATRTTSTIRGCRLGQTGICPARRDHHHLRALAERDGSSMINSADPASSASWIASVLPRPRLRGKRSVNRSHPQPTIRHGVLDAAAVEALFRNALVPDGIWNDNLREQAPQDEQGVRLRQRDERPRIAYDDSQDDASETSPSVVSSGPTISTPKAPR